MGQGDENYLTRSIKNPSHFGGARVWQKSVHVFERLSRPLEIFKKFLEQETVGLGQPTFNRRQGLQKHPRCR
jgi:hypothetical protein